MVKNSGGNAVNSAATGSNNKSVNPTEKHSLKCKALDKNVVMQPSPLTSKNKRSKPEQESEQFPEIQVIQGRKMFVKTKQGKIKTSKLKNSNQNHSSTSTETSVINRFDQLQSSIVTRSQKKNVITPINQIVENEEDLLDLQDSHFMADGVRVEVNVPEEED